VHRRGRQGQSGPLYYKQIPTPRRSHDRERIDPLPWLAAATAFGSAAKLDSRTSVMRCDILPLHCTKVVIFLLKHLPFSILGQFPYFSSSAETLLFRLVLKFI
jgi:hypothetical protein